MAQEQPRLTGELTILVVEDDMDTRQYIDDLLTLEGYHVLTAASGQAALGCIAGHTLDSVLLDRRLPDTDGISLCRTLREQIDSAVPIIVMTADHDSLLESEARKAGATTFLRKPFLPTQLLERLPRGPGEKG